MLIAPPVFPAATALTQSILSSSTALGAPLLATALADHVNLGTSSLFAYTLEGVEADGFGEIIGAAAPFGIGAVALFIFVQAFKVFTDAY